MSRDKPSAKQFSQKMLSKSQHFPGSLQFGSGAQQAMLSQQSYLAQGAPITNNLGVVSSGGTGLPQMQKQNFIHQGLLASHGSASLNTSASQLNSSANYDAAILASASPSTDPHALVGAPSTASSAKRHLSKTSLEKRKHANAAPEQVDANVTYSTQQKMQAAGAGPAKDKLHMPPNSSTGMAQKRFSLGMASSGAGATSSCGVSASVQSAAMTAHASTPGHHNMMASSNGESSNKLRRISNMKHQKSALQDTSTSTQQNSSQQNNKSLVGAD